MSRFKKATREKLRLRAALDGPAGSGKSLTSLRFSFALGKRVAVIDSENRSMSKYQGEEFDGVRFDFDVCNLSSYAPTDYTNAIVDAGKEGYEVVIIDSLSHAWAGEGGALDIKDKQGGNQFTAWRNVTPMHNRMIDSILKSPCHVIATMRNKTEYVMEEDEKGRMVPRKVGMAPIQRAGMEYEFDLYGSMDWSHVLTISKSRCPAVDGAIVVKPGAEFMGPVINWLETGSKPPPPVGDELLAKLEALVKALGTSPGKFSEALRRAYGVDTLDALREDQAIDLQEKLSKPKSNGKATVSPDQAQPTASASSTSDHNEPS